MTTTTNTAEVLNDLIQINNDRIEGYRKAIHQLEPTDTDLKTLFTSFINQSEDLKSTLASEVSSLGEEIDQGTTASGKIYRAWMDVKAVFTGDDRQTALNNCEFGEDAAQKAYHSAETNEDVPLEIRTMISNQRKELRTAHDKVKHLRDSHQV